MESFRETDQVLYNARPIGNSLENRPEFTVCTLVTKFDQYHDMLHSFQRAGFSYETCEFLYADNSQGNIWDARHALRTFLQQAAGKYVLICHQDILLDFDRYDDLLARLNELTVLDPTWGVCGNAGADKRGTLVVRITDPHGRNRYPDRPLPAKVLSLDENFIVVRSETGITFPRDLCGFHWYGSDVCVVAKFLGWESYVIDFHLYHKSGGSTDGSYAKEGALFRTKYSELAKSRWHHVVTGHSIYISPYSSIRASARIINKARQLLGRFRRSVRNIRVLGA